MSLRSDEWDTFTMWLARIFAIAVLAAIVGICVAVVVWIWGRVL